MKFPADKLEELRVWIDKLKTPEVVMAYKTGRFPRAGTVDDLNVRFRWDLYWAALNENDPNHEWRKFTSELNSDHIDTALKRIVEPITRRY